MQLTPYRVQGGPRTENIPHHAPVRSPSGAREADRALLLMGQLVAEGRMDGGSDPLHVLFLPPGPLGSSEPWPSLLQDGEARVSVPRGWGLCPLGLVH